jgi:malate dehydrogenase
MTAALGLKPDTLPIGHAIAGGLPTAAAARMAKAVIEDSGAVMPVCAWVDCEYGIEGVYLGVEAEIGKSVICKAVEEALTPSEVEALKVAAESVRTKQADVKEL